MTDQSKMQIVQLEARNFCNLKAVRITPDKQTVVLTGKNEAGKSNVLNLIQALLEGLKPVLPIRSGEERADAQMSLGDIVIRKRWTQKGEALEVYKIVDGKKQTFSSPQSFLNELTGKMVDPMRLFMMMKDDPKKFRDMLANLVGLDLSDLKAEEQSVRDERKLINDKIRDAIAQLKEMTAPNPDTPQEEVTFKEKLDQINRLREQKQAHDEVEYQRNKNRENIVNAKNEIGQCHEKIRELQEQIQSLTTAVEEMEAKQFRHIDPVSPEQITAAEAEIEKLESLNAEIRDAARYNRKVRESKSFQKESDLLTQKIERIQQDVQTRISSCKFPVPGLSLTDDQVLFEDKPITAASSGRKIRLFTKMAMAMSPNIRVLVVRDGSFLDSDGFRELCEIAAEQDYQVWVEKVADDGTVGIYIEDGEVKAVDGKPVQYPEQEEKVG